MSTQVETHGSVWCYCCEQDYDADENTGQPVWRCNSCVKSCNVLGPCRVKKND